MIFYFTSTGNSRFIANNMAKALNKPVTSLNEVFKNNLKLEFHSQSPFILISPIHAWRVPKKVENFLKNAKFTGSKEIYVIVTMGEDCGLTQKYCKKMIEKNNMILKGFKPIVMPDNYFISAIMKSKDENMQQIKDAIPTINETIDLIRKNESFFQTEYNKNDWFLSSVGNWGFNNFMANSKSFTLSDKCIKCKKCVNICPTNNITLNEKISFSNKCMFCLACLHNCPVHAIDYKGKMAKNGYYVFPQELENF